jgi:calcium-dependent protein kinase
MYILLSGEPPFNGEDDTEILSKVKKGKYDFSSPKWMTISESAKLLINQLLVFNPEDRLKANEALKHEWFKQMLKRKINKKDSVSLTKTLKDLGSFRIEQKMQQAALTYMANHLIGEEELKQLNKAFKALDVDNNGKLSKEELIAGYK